MGHFTERKKDLSRNSSFQKPPSGEFKSIETEAMTLFRKNAVNPLQLPCDDHKKLLSPQAYKVFSKTIHTI